MAQIKPISGVDDRVALADALPLASPFTLNVFPTNACNFKCSYCAHSMGSQELAETYSLDKGFMSMETMAAIVEQSKAFAVNEAQPPYKLLSFMGHGEPLLDRTLPEKIKLASKAKIADRIEIITNASMLTNDFADELIDSGLTNLRVSLQGLDREAYKKTCGYTIDFDRFIAQLEYFYKKKKPGMGLFVKIMDIALPPYIQEDFYSMFGDMSDRMYIERVQPVYHNVKVQAGSTETQTRSDRYGNVHEPRLVCPLAFFTLSVWPNGDAEPCDAIYRPCRLGNVHKSTLRDMWESDKLKRFRTEHLKRKKNILDGCKNCCAPDDVSHPKDALDGFEDLLIERYGER